jgi:NADH-quinone oxidoreductase subunit K
LLNGAFGDDKAVKVEPVRTAQIGESLFRTYVLPFEVISVLLLAALIGAVVLARKDEPERGGPSQRAGRSATPRASEPTAASGTGTGGRLVIRLVFPLFFSAVLFSAGIYGVLARRNAVLILMSIELMLNAVNLNLVAFSATLRDITGQIFALFVIAVAAAEVGIGLAIVILVYRNRETSNVDEVDLLKW